MCGKTARNTLKQYTKKTKQKNMQNGLIYKGDSQSYILLSMKLKIKDYCFYPNFVP